MKLNLGCSDKHIAGFLSVDIVEPADQIVDLSKLWPWPDSVIDEVIAFDVIEHIENKTHFMNELYRVMKHGAIVDIEVPSAERGGGAFQDPTHKSYWVANSFQYYEDGSFARQRFAKAYGVTARFKILELREHEVPDVVNPVWKIRVKLQAVKT